MFRCTYEQRNFILINTVSLIQTIFYFILTSYYLVVIYKLERTYMSATYRLQLYKKSFSDEGRKSVENRKQLILLVRLRQFLYVIRYSYASLIIIHLSYICLLTIILCLSQTPFKWSLMKTLFNAFFLINYCSIPIRTSLLFIYCFVSKFSTYIQTIIFYLFNTKLRCSCRWRKPNVCFKLHFNRHAVDLNQKKHIDDSLEINLPEPNVKDRPNLVKHDSIILYNVNNNYRDRVMTTTVTTTALVTNS